MSDAKLNPCPVAQLTPFLDIVNQCTKRISSSRVQLQREHSGWVQLHKHESCHCVHV